MKLTTSNRKFIFISKDEVGEVSKHQKERFLIGKTVKGTRDYHSFRVLSRTDFEARNFTLQKNGKRLTIGQDISIDQYQINDFVAVRFDNDFNIGKVKELDDENISIEFFKKRKPGKTYFFTWPKNAPLHSTHPSDIICNVSEPVGTTATNRLYKIPDEEIDKIILIIKDKVSRTM